MNMEFIKCPKCEGYGKAVNHFDLPRNLFRDSSFIIDNKKYRSDGREYYAHDCEMCEGKGWITVFKR